MILGRKERRVRKEGFGVDISRREISRPQYPFVIFAFFVAKTLNSKPK